LLPETSDLAILLKSAVPGATGQFCACSADYYFYTNNPPVPDFICSYAEYDFLRRLSGSERVNAELAISSLAVAVVIASTHFASFVKYQKTVTHLSINPAQLRVTSLMCPKMLTTTKPNCQYLTI